MQLLKSCPMGAVCAVMITSIVFAPIAASAGAEPADQKTLEEEVPFFAPHVKEQH